MACIDIEISPYPAGPASATALAALIPSIFAKSERRRISLDEEKFN
jgi:hypothetical protein